ncbi:unnamed protein product [Nyctereutes procyonoides]|uniref:(raccoon dog) hypothetical protein n=1 Tax=Nyctereutes procyonoides TaxID=34880 RepID=A0A811Z8W0_NYCPR|nr:unnamed protein product [Nyctereutes procyonoides]
MSASSTNEQNFTMIKEETELELGFNREEMSFRFGQHLIKPSVVFLKTELSFALVNRKPVVPGQLYCCKCRLPFISLTDILVAPLFRCNDCCHLRKGLTLVISENGKGFSLTLMLPADGPGARPETPAFPAARQLLTGSVRSPKVGIAVWFVQDYISSEPGAVCVAWQAFRKYLLNE